MDNKVLSALLVFYFLCVISCSQISIKSGNKTIQVKAKSVIAKTFKKVDKLEKAADLLVNATRKYEKLLSKPIDVDNDPRYANLTAEMKEKVLEVQQKVRDNLESQIDKVWTTSENIKDKAEKIRAELEKAAEVLARNRELIKKVTGGKTKTTNGKGKGKKSKSFIGTDIQRSVTKNLKKATNEGKKVASKSKTVGGKVSNAKEKIQQVNEKVSEATAIAQTCTKSFFEAIPPTICWKKGADVGKIPTGCPPGYFRYLALCFKNCEPGTHFDGGALCIGGCPSGYRTDPLTCYRWWPPKILGRRTYFPKSITNFEAPCEEGFYRAGALCYWDCNKIGMINCGIGMCAASSEACASGITQMVIGTVSSIGKGIGFVLSFGASASAVQGIAAAKNAANTALKSVQKATKSAMAIMKNLAKNEKARKNLLKKAMDSAKEKIKELIKGKIKEKMSEQLSAICAKVHEGLIGKVANGDQKKKEFNIQSLDPIGIVDITKKCKSPDGTNGKIDCAKSILSSLDNVDPTGLCGLASAFMQPICDV